MSTLGQLAEWLVRLTEGDAGPSPAAQTESHGGRLESLRRVIGAYARLHRPEPESERCEVLFRWGHLEVLERIGSGSYGEVYRAFDGVLERDVALKLRSSEQVAARAYILEARRLARVRHPNVLAIHGAAVNDGRVGMWADLIDGRTLSAWVAENGPRPRAEVLEAGRMLASALAAVHRAGLIHGDVKPGNIMRGADGGLVLMDFGAAIERAAGGAQATLGSPLTMAPEQLDGSPIGPAADLYALGVVLFHLATGRYPLEATSIDGLAGLHARGAVVDPEPLVRALGRAPTRLIERLLARDPAARPSAEETLDAWREIERAPQRRQKRLAVGAVIAALVLALVASGIGYFKVRDQARRAEEIKNFTLSLFDRANVFHIANRGEVSAADLLRGGVERVEKELVGEPRVQAELLTELFFPSPRKRGRSCFFLLPASGVRTVFPSPRERGQNCFSFSPQAGRRCRRRKRGAFRLGAATFERPRSRHRGTVGIEATSHIAMPVAPHPALRATFSPLAGRRESMHPARGEKGKACTPLAGRRERHAPRSRGEGKGMHPACGEKGKACTPLAGRREKHEPRLRGEGKSMCPVQLEERNVP